MRAIVLPAYGPASSLELRTLPDPTPGASEIVVRMVGASINPVDWKQASGHLAKWMPLELPAVLGRDASGTVVAVGSGVTEFALGERVLGRPRGGAWAEVVVGAVGEWARVPTHLDLAEAGALPLALLTGAQLAEDALAAGPGQVILVTGATGSVGRVAVFAARARGAKVYAGVRGKHKGEAAKLGAEGVVALDDAAEVAGLPALDGIADTVGGPAMQAVLGKVKLGGKIGSVVGEPAGAKDKGLEVRAIFTKADPARLAELTRAVADGRLVVPIARKFPLAEAAAALAFAEKGAGGKVLLLG
jgi:NADPH:quinone reductase-like Zn-dependent oxidoreductase